MTAPEAPEAVAAAAGALYVDTGSGGGALLMAVPTLQHPALRPLSLATPSGRAPPLATRGVHASGGGWGKWPVRLMRAFA